MMSIRNLILKTYTFPQDEVIQKIKIAKVDQNKKFHRLRVSEIDRLAHALNIKLEDFLQVLVYYTGKEVTNG